MRSEGRFQVKDFSNFYEMWRKLVRAQQGAKYGQDVYFQTGRDREGFELLPDFYAVKGEDWAVAVTREFEKGSSLSARLDTAGIAKFRMIQDRHLVNLTRGLFDDDYYTTSDERALFLIYNKVPPLRVSAALSKAKNASLDILHLYAMETGVPSHRLLSAMSTSFMIELHHTMRAYVYFERHNSDAEAHFEVVKQGDDGAHTDYSAPTRNRQMTMPDKRRHGSVELF